MTLNLSLSPESEARLQERAAQAGQDVTAFVRRMIEEKLEERSNRSDVSPRQGTAEWLASFKRWVTGHPPRPFLADDSREAIYGERD